MVQRHYYPPLIPVTLAYALGICAQAWFHGPVWALGVLTALSFAFALVYFKRCAALGLILAVFFCLGALRAEEAARLPVRHIAHATPRKARWIELEGVVVSSPREARLFTGYTLRAQRVHRKDGGTVGICGDVEVRDYHKTRPVPGERLRIWGKLYKPRGLFAEPLARRHVYSILNVSRKGTVRSIGRGVGRWSPLCARRRLADIFSRHFDPAAASLLRAMMLGEKGLVPRPVQKAMIAAGTWHIMVVSGFHTAFVAGLVFLFLKILRVPARPRLLLSMAAVVGYCFLTGAAVSVVRATLMTLALMYAFLRERHPLFWHVLAMAALLLLLGDPAALASISFQLSFVSVVSIISLMPFFDPAPWLNRMWRPSHPFFRLLRLPLTWAAVSLCAWLGTTPLIAAVFGVVSLYGVAANIVAVPLALGVIGSGSLVLCLAPFSENLAAAAAAACAFLLKLQVAWSAWIAGWPLAQVRLALPGAGAAALYALMVLGVLRLSKGGPQREGRDKKSCRR